MKPIPISVLTAVTNSALNAASVFPSRRIEISDFERVIATDSMLAEQPYIASLGDCRLATCRRERIGLGIAAVGIGGDPLNAEVNFAHFETGSF
jgi:hypothetical protein